jgi:hypothetical protein
VQQAILGSLLEARRFTPSICLRLARALILMNNAVANDNIPREPHDDPAAVARVLANVWNAAIYGRTEGY